MKYASFNSSLACLVMLTLPTNAFPQNNGSIEISVEDIFAEVDKQNGYVFPLFELPKTNLYREPPGYFGVRLQATLKGNPNFLITRPTGGTAKQYDERTKNSFFVFLDIARPPDTKIFKTFGKTGLPAGYSFPALESLPLAFAKTWQLFLKQKYSQPETFHPMVGSPFHSTLHHGIHLCSLREIKPDAVKLLCRDWCRYRETRASYPDDLPPIPGNRERRTVWVDCKPRFCLCGLEEITPDLATAFAKTPCVFLFSGETSVSDEANKILLDANGRDFELGDPRSISLGRKNYESNFFPTSDRGSAEFILLPNGCEHLQQFLECERTERVHKANTVDNPFNRGSEVQSSRETPAPHPFDNRPMREPFGGHSRTEADELPEITNSIGIKMKLIPAGTFTMGDGYDAHEVTLTQPFYLGVTEVTNAQWQAVMGSVPSAWRDADHPVEHVNWEDTVAFCKKLSAEPEERAAGRVYRLPTEAEWEYACLAGSTTRYAPGSKLRLEFGWFVSRGGNQQTHPVGQKRPNAWGLYDMYGNVDEWCSDWYGDYPGGAATDPRGPSTGSERVIRRDWSGREGVLVGVRKRGWDPHDQHYLGFRLALSPSGVKGPEAGK